MPLLFAHFLARARRALRPAGRRRSAAAVRDHLAGHDWPGNVRELLHFADRVALGLAAEEAAAGAAAAAPGEGTLPERIDRYRGRADPRGAACPRAATPRATIEALGLPRKTFYDKLKRHGIQRSDFER